MMKNLKDLSAKWNALIDRVANFINERNPQEKKKILIFAACLLFFVDYWIALAPTINAFMKGTPKIHELKAQRKSLKDDMKNRRLIEKDWSDVKAKIDNLEKSFVSTDDTSTVLENLSKLASESGVKITSLTPSQDEKKEKGSFYLVTPIKISALAGTHEFGKFLAKLESGSTFFKVKDIKILAEAGGGRDHAVELAIEAYRKQ